MLHDFLLATVVSGQFSLFGHLLTVKLSGYGIAIVLSSIALYTLYVRRIRTRAVPPPIATWGLWLLLDVVATGAEFGRGICNVQLVTYTIGTGVICAVLLWRRNTAWDRLWDNLTTAFVVLSIVAWLLASPTLGLIISLVGMTVATLPLLRAITDGADEPTNAWFVAVLGSVLGYLDGNALSGIWLGLLQALILCLVLVFTHRRKNFQP